ncbi:MAG: spermidine/putrescine ABC transporter substrate-binding protein [Thermorudis peleae]|nr:spermidine/putrescine ABC transporter substrate-binding protein [Thermorudis peleae]
MTRSAAIARLLRQWQTGRMTRRELISRLTALGLSMSAITALLSACGGSSSSNQSNSASGTQSTEATAKPSPIARGIPDYVDKTKLAKELNFFNWSDYIEPGLLDEFERIFGVKVTQDTYDSNEDLLAKLQGGATGYDVIVPSDYTVSILIKLNMLEPLDYSVIKSISNIDPNNLKPYYDPENKYSVPYMWGTSGFGYNTEAIKQELSSWKDVFEPQPALQKKIVMLNDEREVIGAALMYLGYSINETSDEALAKAKSVLMQQKPSVLAYTSNNQTDLLVSGEALLAHLWTGNYIQAHNQKSTITYVIPKEGCTVWQDNLCVLKSAPHKYTAMVFIDFLNWPEVNGRNTNYIGYASPNKAARDQKLIDESMLNDPKVYPPQDVWQRLQWIKDIGEATQKFDRLWTEVKTA